MGHKILILGIGDPQADAIYYCKSMGLEVHACAHSEEGLDKVNVDHFSLIDIKDHNHIYEYSLKNNVQLIYSVGSDVALSTISYVSEKLGLPNFNDLYAVGLCRNKDQLRSFMGDDFYGKINFLSASSICDTENWNLFPCVIKPADSQGQRGFFVIASRQDLIKYFDQSMAHSSGKRVIIEEFVEGPELSANLYMAEGKIAFFQITDRVVYEQYPGIVRAHRIPSRITDQRLEGAIYRLCEDVVNKLHLLNGPVYFQLKLKGNQPKLIEVTPRLDGCHLWQLIREYCGINLLDTAFRHLLGDDVNIKRNDAREQLTLKFITEKPGVAVKKENYTGQKDSTTQWYYDEGERVRLVNGYCERLAHYIENS